ncbi:hypothetical protein [Streptomyces sp. NBC_01320]|uniref:hypothetical protein n=1 Tax=Streptomyces sp. NBC_01320 TaxID=2903824 RepID=UPI002E12CE8A|nr:hypothetical protein OG395_46110 [Streptomyces sp. NBC_01320]
MAWFIGAGMLGGLLLIALGTASIRTGWTLPWVGHRVTRPSVYGLGALLVGVPCVMQGLFYFGIAPIPSWEVRFFGANALTLSGLVLIGVGQMRPWRRRE